MRKDQFRVTAAVDNRDLGVFETFTGGEADSDETVYKLGGMGPKVSLGGSVNVGEVTISQLHTNVVLQLVPWLISRVGKGRLVIKKQALDIDGNAFGKPLTYPGVLKTVTPPEVDANATDASVLELVQTPDGTIT